MTEYKVGDKVKTNVDYWQLYSRCMYGEIVKLSEEGSCAILHVSKVVGKPNVPQEPPYQILVMTHDLELDILEQ